VSRGEVEVVRPVEVRAVDRGIDEVIVSAVRKGDRLSFEGLATGRIA
jgi:hypothetical protein